MVCMWVLDTLLFSLQHIHINWLRDHTSWAQVELEWRLKVYIHLFLNSEICIVHAINCEWSRSVKFLLRMFCMQYKHMFFQQWVQSIKCGGDGCFILPPSFLPRLATNLPPHPWFASIGFQPWFSTTRGHVGILSVLKHFSLFALA